jgi:hypothetical protein
MGSQWWCLRRSTVSAILAFVRKRPDVLNYFRSVWIPDESFFQTVIRSVVPQDEFAGFCLTLYEFSDYGKPIVFFDEHLSYLQRKPYFFGRKFAASAVGIRTHLLKSAGTARSGKPVIIDPSSDSLSHRSIVTPYREPVFRRRYPGRMENEWFGELRFSEKPIYLVLSNYVVTERFMRFLSQQKLDLTVHGRLFHGKRIGFIGTDVFGGYAATSVSARNRGAVQFMSNVVEAAPSPLTFAMSWDDNSWIREVLLSIDRSRVILWVPGELRRSIELGAAEILEVRARLADRLGSVEFAAQQPDDVIAAEIDAFQNERSIVEFIDSDKFSRTRSLVLTQDSSLSARNGVDDPLFKKFVSSWRVFSDLLEAEVQGDDLDLRIRDVHRRRRSFGNDPL